VACIGFRCGGWDDDDLDGAIEIYDDAADMLNHYATSVVAGGAIRR
jgi:hypothetical protein